MPSFECRGFTLGLSLGYGRGLVAPTAATRQWPQLTRLLCAACRAADPEFRFTSIQVNLNTKYWMHTDGKDAGPSRMICFGNFKEGRLWLHDGDENTWSAVDCHDRWAAFDGREFHLTEDWQGPERYSLVYFSSDLWKKAHRSKKGQAAKAELEALGFPWPERHDTFQNCLLPEGKRRIAAVDALPPQLRTEGHLSLAL